jgi:hypothetical protein
VKKLNGKGNGSEKTKDGIRRVRCGYIDKTHENIGASEKIQ